MRKVFTAIKHTLDNIYLIDKILILYMMILLTYTAVHLFDGGVIGESTTVDTIIRTSASAIFGYFISNNFVKANDDTKSQNTFTSNIHTENFNEMNIQKQSDLSSKDAKNTVINSGACCSRLQIIVVSGIGLISLILLLVSRNHIKTTPEFSATVSQLRDFLSACIGFLVSCGKAK